MKSKRLVSTVNLPKDEWLKIRRESGITASQVGAIMGMSKWDSPMSIYLDKTGVVELEKEDNQFMEWGRRLEPLISDKFAENHPEFKIQKVNAILYNPDFPLLIGDIDRLIIDKETKQKGVLEIKTASEYSKEQWEGEEIPAGYILQAAAYMYILNVDFAYFACLCGGNHYIEKRIERDNELIELIINAVKDFWENHVLVKNPPAVDGSEASTDILNVLYPKAIENTKITLDDNFDSLIQERESIKESIKELDLKAAEIENKIKDQLQENEQGTTNHYKITWKNQQRNTFDSKRFQADSIDLYNKYIKTSTSRVLKISKL